MKLGLHFILVLILTGCASLALAQVQDTIQVEEDVWDDDEDFSMYDDIDFADEGTKRYATSKIFDLSPQRFISIHWDAQMRYKMDFSPRGSYPPDTDITVGETATANYTGGLRLMANIPVISKNSVIWQMGANYWRTNYNISDIATVPGQPISMPSVARTLSTDGLTTMGLNTTVFKPLDDEQFILFQGSADLSGNYSLGSLQPINTLRYSAAVLWGKKTSDRKQWAFGVARTYRVGELNYLPIVMYNYTAPSRKWGTEILFPARAHYRRTYNPRSILLAGYELEGQSYRLRQFSDDDNSFEIRRGELRIRAEYMRQISGFIWFSAQAGLRYNYIFHADNITNNGRDFFRGFFGDQPYAMLNQLGHPIYFNIGVHLVSP